MTSFDRLEGRRHAVETLGSVQGMPVCMVLASDVVKNLRNSWGNRPGEYAKGVMEVLDALAKS